jgi:hypothetical protein
MSDTEILGTADPVIAAERLARGDYQTEMEIRTAISLIGESKTLTARRLIETYLDHASPGVRQSALWVLTMDWGIRDHAQRCIDIIVDQEQSFDLRVAALSGLGQLLEATKDVNALMVLTKVLRDASETFGIRARTYAAIQAIEGVPFLERLRTVDNAAEMTAAVNWSWISQIEARYERA